MEDLGIIKTKKGNRFKVFWNKFTQAVWFKNRIDGPSYIAPSARNENDAKRFAKEEADQIEN